MSLKIKFVNGIFWSFLQQFSTQIISFIVQIILARILLPSEFGLIGMLTVFMGIGSALFEGGMANSLIRETTVNKRDYSTIFFFNLVISSFLYLFFYLFAPFIAKFYNQPSITDIARVYGLSFIFLAFGTVQNTILLKEMNFKKQAYISFPALLIGSTFGIYLAYNGFGVWSLVYSMLITNFLNTLLLWVSSDWRPEFIFDWDKFKSHFNFGYKMTISSILDSLFSNVYQIIIGKKYNSDLVGYYTRANSLMMLPIGNISSILNKVVFPLFSSVHDDIIKLRDLYKKIMAMVFFIVSPLIVLMILLSKEIVVLLFTDKWLPSVPIFQILCVSGLLYPLHLYNLMILQVKGKSSLFLKLEIIKKVIAVFVIGVSIYFGFYALIIGSVITSTLSLFINTYYAGEFIQYPMKSQLWDLAPILFISILMAIGVYFLNVIFIDFSNLWRLLFSSCLGGCIYLFFAFFFRNQSMNELIKIINNR
jgi:teichuronic acid exporter